MTRILLTLSLLAGLAACSGFDAAQRMPQQEIAALSDEEVCGYLRTFAYKGRLPDAWDEEAVRRGLTRCVEQGMKRRVEDRKLDRSKPILCPQGASTQDSRCW